MFFREVGKCVYLNVLMAFNMVDNGTKLLYFFSTWNSIIDSSIREQVIMVYINGDICT